MSCGINKENQELKEKHWKAVRIDPVLVKIDIYLKVKMAGCFQTRTQLLTGLWTASSFCHRSRSALAVGKSLSLRCFDSIPTTLQ